MFIFFLKKLIILSLVIFKHRYQISKITINKSNKVINIMSKFNQKMSVK